MSNRRKILEVSADLVAGLLPGWHDLMSLTTDAPKDIKIVGCGWDETKNTIRLAVESETFDEVEDGRFAPYLTLTVTQRRSELDAVIHLLTPESEDAS